MALFTCNIMRLFERFSQQQIINIYELWMKTYFQYYMTMNIYLKIDFIKSLEILFSFLLIKIILN